MTVAATKPRERPTPTAASSTPTPRPVAPGYTLTDRHDLQTIRRADESIVFTLRAGDRWANLILKNLNNPKEEAA